LVTVSKDGYQSATGEIPFTLLGENYDYWVNMDTIPAKFNPGDSANMPGVLYLGENPVSDWIEVNVTTPNSQTTIYTYVTNTDGSFIHNQPAMTETGLYQLSVYLYEDGSLISETYTWTVGTTATPTATQPPVQTTPSPSDCEIVDVQYPNPATAGENVTFTGKVVCVDETGELAPQPDWVVKLLDPAVSSGVQTDQTGKFSINIILDDLSESTVFFVAIDDEFYISQKVYWSGSIMIIVSIDPAISLSQTDYDLGELLEGELTLNPGFSDSSWDEGLEIVYQIVGPIDGSKKFYSFQSPGNYSFGIDPFYWQISQNVEVGEYQIIAFISGDYIQTQNVEETFWINGIIHTNLTAFVEEEDKWSSAVLTGVFTDSEDSPIPGADIRITFQEDEAPNREFSLTGRTDQEGRFKIDLEPLDLFSGQGQDDPWRQRNWLTTIYADKEDYATGSAIINVQTPTIKPYLEIISLNPPLDALSKLAAGGINYTDRLPFDIEVTIKYNNIFDGGKLDVVAEGNWALSCVGGDTWEAPERKGHLSVNDEELEEWNIGLEPNKHRRSWTLPGNINPSAYYWYPRLETQINAQKGTGQIETIMVSGDLFGFSDGEDINPCNTVTYKDNPTQPPDWLQTSWSGAKVQIGFGGSAVNIHYPLLPSTSDYSITVVPNETELLANGVDTTEVRIEVRDLLGNPIPDRDFTLELQGDVGPGSLSTNKGTTDANGVIQVTYTAFNPISENTSDTTRHEIVIVAQDDTSGDMGRGSIFVNQYLFSVVQTNPLIPACHQCDFPSKLTIQVTDYWLAPIPNFPLNLEIEGTDPGGFLSRDSTATTGEPELSLITDQKGIITFYYRWAGDLTISEVTEKILIKDDNSNTLASQSVEVHGLDIGIGSIEEAGFTGVTGQQAYFKIYFKEYNHTDLPLDRFNAETLQKLGLRVTISQYHSDGVNTSQTYEQTGGWAQDEKGWFVEMYHTPSMPYVVPANDGGSWYEVRVDPVIDETVYLPDTYRPNNSTIFAVTTNSPDGWLHIWLKDGILTPHNWYGVAFKCVGRFLPFLGDAMTVIDTLNQTYNQDVLGLGQSVETVLTENLQSFSSSTKLTKIKAGIINNVISCMQDAYSVYKQSGTLDRNCAVLSRMVADPNELTPELIANIQDRFAQGVMMGSPDLRGLVVNNLSADEITLRDSAGAVVNNPEMMSSEGQVIVFLLPVDETFDLEISADHDFNLAVYDEGNSEDKRHTTRHSLETTTAMTGIMTLGPTSDNTLGLDQDGDGVMETILVPEVIPVDTSKPQILSMIPEEDASVTADGTFLMASFADNQGGCGIDPNGVKLFVDGEDHTHLAEVDASTLILALSNLDVGEHKARMIVTDLDGNATIAESTFTINKASLLSQLSQMSPALLIGIGIGLLVLIGLIVGLIIFFKRKSRQPKQVMSHKKMGCGFSILITALMALLVFGFFALVALDLIPVITLTPSPQPNVDEILKLGGGGLLLTVLGAFMLRGGYRSIKTRQVLVEDDFGRNREKRGLGAVINGIGQVTFGILFLISGLGLIGLNLVQQILPMFIPLIP
jgi:hypothetical protein